MVKRRAMVRCSQPNRFTLPIRLGYSPSAMHLPTLRTILSAGLGCVISTATLTGCSGEDPPAVEIPSPAQVRDYFGLNADSCWRYRYKQGSANLYRRADVAGPNETSISGHTVYVRKLAYESGGLPVEWYLETELNGEVRLLRSATGRDRDARETRRYETEPTPLFGALEYDFSGNIDLKVGTRFTTETATPDLCTGMEQSCAPGPTERHEWTVSNTEMVATPDGEEMAIKMNYKVTDDTRTTTEVYWLVPGKGIAKFTGDDGTVYQVCNWRVCDAAGACTGAANCTDMLTCN